MCNRLNVNICLQNDVRATADVLFLKIYIVSNNLTKIVTWCRKLPLTGIIAIKSVLDISIHLSSRTQVTRFKSLFDIIKPSLTPVFTILQFCIDDFQVACPNFHSFASDSAFG